MQIKKTKSVPRKIILLLVLTSLCVVLPALSGVSNMLYPDRSDSLETLSENDKVRLAETIHLRQKLGDQVWPGFGQANIPLLVYNEEYAFLVGITDPEKGWRTVPWNKSLGAAWEVVPGEEFEGSPYYRQNLPDPDTTPQAFTVRVGDEWAASLQTRTWMEISLGNMFRDSFQPVSAIIPYRIIADLFIKGTDHYIVALEHESFHAYEGIQNQTILETAEKANGEFGEQYPWEDEDMIAAWQTELDLLNQALQSTSDEETRALARQFLENRNERRTSSGVSRMLILFEKQREWTEGQAKYVELEIWRQAASDPDYFPLPETARLTDFNGYADFEKMWTQEVAQIKRMANDHGDGRFYYSGMAQAVLLDRFMPGWKLEALENGAYLEDLLASAIQ